MNPKDQLRQIDSTTWDWLYMQLENDIFQEWKAGTAVREDIEMLERLMTKIMVINGDARPQH